MADDSFFLEHTKYVISDTVLVTTSRLGKSEIDWHAFKRWAKVGNFYLLFVSKKFIKYIPESAFPAQQKAEPESLLNRKIIKS